MLNSILKLDYSYIATEKSSASRLPLPTDTETVPILTHSEQRDEETGRVRAFQESDEVCNKLRVVCFQLLQLVAQLVTGLLVGFIASPHLPSAGLFNSTALGILVALAMGGLLGATPWAELGRSLGPRVWGAISTGDLAWVPNSQFPPRGDGPIDNTRYAVRFLGFAFSLAFLWLAAVCWLSFRFLMLILIMIVGLFLSGRRFKFLWHCIAYWCYLLVAAGVGTYAFLYGPSWAAGGGSSGSVYVIAVLIAVGVVLVGFVELAGDIEEKSQIVIIFSLRHLNFMYEDGRGLMIGILSCFVLILYHCLSGSLFFVLLQCICRNEVAAGPAAV